MNPYPGDRSILILDNCAIHKSRALREVIEASPAMFLDELQDWLALEHDVLISKTALHQNIRGARLTYKLLRRRAAERDEDAREQWKEDVHLNFVTAQMVWTDESSEDNHTTNHFGISRCRGVL